MRIAGNTCGSLTNSIVNFVFMSPPRNYDVSWLKLCYCLGTTRFIILTCWCDKMFNKINICIWDDRHLHIVLYAAQFCPSWPSHPSVRPSRWWTVATPFDLLKQSRCRWNGLIMGRFRVSALVGAQRWQGQGHRQAIRLLQVVLHFG